MEASEIHSLLCEMFRCWPLVEMRSLLLSFLIGEFGTFFVSRLSHVNDARLYIHTTYLYVWFTVTKFPVYLYV